MDYKALFVLEAGLEPAQPQWPRDFNQVKIVVCRW